MSFISPLYKKKVNPIKKEKITIRKFRQSAIIEFGAWLVKFDWSVLLNISNVNQKIDYFMSIMWNMINKFFPPIKVAITNCDKKWITPNIKLLIAQRQQAHLCKNFEVRDHLAKKVKQEIKKAKNNYNSSMADTLLSLKPNAKEWYQHIAKITNSNKKKTLCSIAYPNWLSNPMMKLLTQLTTTLGLSVKPIPLWKKTLQLRITSLVQT